MKTDYQDILKRIADPPLWFDQNGVPRFDIHHPRLSPDIYTKEVVLLEIACQACYRRIDVQMACDSFEVMDWCRQATTEEERHARAEAVMRDGYFGYLTQKHLKARNEYNKAFPDLSSYNETWIHYGDPPAHNNERGEYCHVGCTMNCYDLAVLEFWKRKDFEWVRVPEFEILLERVDALDMDRLWK